MRAVFAVVGAVAGALTGLILALFIAMISGGDNDLAVAFRSIESGPVGALIGLLLGIFIALRLSRRSHKTLIAGFSMILPAILAAMLWTIFHRGTPPSDKELLANFERHEHSFNEMVEMLKTDKDLVGVDVDRTDPEGGISPARISAYRGLLREAYVPRGFQRLGLLGEIDFLYWDVGSAISSDIFKGYAYLETPPPNLRDSLDGYKPEEEKEVWAYRHIRGNWYLYYEYIPG